MFSYRLAQSTGGGAAAPPPASPEPQIRFRGIPKKHQNYFPHKPRLGEFDVFWEYLTNELTHKGGRGHRFPGPASDSL